MTKVVELRRHTDNDGDALTADGVRAALEIGTRLGADYTVLVSSGMQRATQTLACFLAGLGSRVPGGVIVETGLRTESEGRWREIYAQTGEPQLAAFRVAHLISAARTGVLPATHFRSRGRKLMLVFEHRMVDLVADRVGSRFKQLARLVGRAGSIVRS